MTAWLLNTCWKWCHPYTSIARCWIIYGVETVITRYGARVVRSCTCVVVVVASCLANEIRRERKIRTRTVISSIVRDDRFAVTRIWSTQRIVRTLVRLYTDVWSKVTLYRVRIWYDIRSIEACRNSFMFISVCVCFILFVYWSCRSQWILIDFYILFLILQILSIIHRVFY